MSKRSARCPKCRHVMPLADDASDRVQCPKCQAVLVLPGQPDPLIGKTLGEYELVSLLGRGGMGVVYRARQTSLDRPVAVKVLPRDLSGNAKFVTRFEREARSAASVVHNHIVQVYTVGEAEGHRYIAMEFVDGEPLDQVLKREGRLDPERALAILKQVTAALAKARDANIVHRDIKPSNILLTSDGVAKVADFGLAKRPDEDVNVTATGTSLGTPRYMPPEAAQGKELDHRSDLYSLGATFYHLLAGRPVFEGTSTAELAVKHVTETPMPLAQAAPGIDRRFARIIDKLLRKNPDARYADAGALLAELEALGPLGRGVDQAAVTRERPARAPERRTAPAGKTPLLVAASIVGVLAIGVTLWVLLPGGGEPAKPRPKARVILPPETRTKTPPPRKAPIPVPKPKQAEPEPPRPEPEPPKPEPAQPVPAGEWMSLFDGATLDGWERIVKRAGPNRDWSGDVSVADGRVVVEPGSPWGGFACTRTLPTADYAFEFETMRLDNSKSDFCVVFFPIGPHRTALGIGPFSYGIGLIKMDGKGQESNETYVQMRLEPRRWYRVRLLVREEHVQGWVDEVPVLDLRTAGHTFGGTADTLEHPFALASYKARSAFRNVRFQRLDPRPADPPSPWQRGEWVQAFDGRSLGVWVPASGFPGQGKVHVQDGTLRLERGRKVTGVVWNAAAPAHNYELRLEAMRVEGNSDAPAITFPANQWRYTLYMGGWDNTKIGLDGPGCGPPAKGMTSWDFAMDNGRWYRLHLRVTDERIAFWVDGRRQFDIARKPGPWQEPPWMKNLIPLAFTSCESTVALRHIEFRRYTGQADPEPAAAAPAQDGWRDLFDGKTLNGWRQTKWLPGKPGSEAIVRDGAIMPDGRGVRAVIVWDGDMPRTDYELAVEFMPLEETGMILEVALPVGDRHFGFVFDKERTWVRFQPEGRRETSRPEYAKPATYQVGRWHRLHFRVSRERIALLVDGLPVLDVPAAMPDYKDPIFVQRMSPMGICFARPCSVRSVRLRTAGEGEPRVGKGVTPEQNAAAIEAGLAWLVSNQEKDGRWDAPKRGNGPGWDVGVTGLALLAFANTGDDLQGRYKPAVTRGLTWLLDKLDKEGRFEFENFYEQGIGAMALCQLSMHSDSATLRAAAQRAVGFICREQPDHGGFRYRGACTKEDGDLSVAGWQMTAMHLARRAGLAVPAANVRRSLAFLGSAYVGDGRSRYTIDAQGPGSPAVAAIGGLCRHYLGGDKGEMRAVADYLLSLLDTQPGNADPEKAQAMLGVNLYFTYYSTRFLHAMGGEDWRRWDAAFRKPVIDLQATTDGAERGSWDPGNHGHCKTGGRACTTALAVLCLQLPMAGN